MCDHIYDMQNLGQVFQFPLIIVFLENRKLMKKVLTNLQVHYRKENDHFRKKERDLRIRKKNFFIEYLRPDVPAAEVLLLLF
jgi:hypothetical protein